MFGDILIDPNTSLTRHNHFQAFSTSLLLLFRCATGEAWQQVMMACVEGQQCDPRATKKGRNCGSNAAYTYFVSFIFFCSFLMLNLFVAVIMDNFDYLTRDSSILGAHHLDEFIRVWAEYDPNATGYIHFTEMYDMLRNMDPPLGFGNKCPSRLAYKKLIRMNMPITQGGKVNFTTTLFALIRENLNIKMRSADEMDQADRELRVTLQKLWPLQAKKIINKLLPPHEELNAGKLTVGKIYAGLLIHENWKTTRFGQKPGPGGLSGTSLIARLMGAVRNSNTRASHASVEMAGADTRGQTSGSGAGLGALDSPHLANEGPDRRPSFSYLRRASERRRRLRMKDRHEDDTGTSPRHGYGPDRYQRGSESGLEAELGGRRDSELGQEYSQGQQQRLQRSGQIYDEETFAEQQLDNMDVSRTAQERIDDYVKDDTYPLKTRERQQQQNQAISNEDHRRQSVNDRLTDVVSDAIEFVREESFKRKRYSMHRRRQAGLSGYSVGSAGGQSGTGSGGGGGGGTEAEMESESATTGAGDRSNYRRRRLMRRSPRRSAQPRVYNDSDTGSVASMTNAGGLGGMTMDQQHLHHLHQHHQHQQQQQQHSHSMSQQRFRLQQHGGSVQDGRMLYGGATPHHHGHTSELMLQHRRHMSADASSPSVQQESSGYFAFQQPYASITGTGYDGADNSGPENECKPILRPIQVGASPPPLVDPATGQTLLEARCKRDEELGGLGRDDEETAIHVGPELDENATTKGQGTSKSPVRFIAPKVAPLNSPSAMPVADEEIIPPNVPYRGRRLPQIPGSNIIKSATDFLHSSIYGRPLTSGGTLDCGPLGPTSVAISTVAPTPLLVAGSRFVGSMGPYRQAGEQAGESIFPSVSESPTIKLETPIPPQPGLIKRQQPPLETVGGSSFEGSGSINFPRVSFSPTHSVGPQPGTSSKFHPGGPQAGPASTMIATQASGGTQSTVLAPTNVPVSEALIAERGSLAWIRGRRSKKEDEDDWF